MSILESSGDGIVMDLLKAFLGNRSENTFQRATMEVNECYSSLLGNSQRANKLAG
jgi:hypothetical protein